MKNKLQNLQGITEMAFNAEKSKLKKIALEFAVKSEAINRLDISNTKRILSLHENGGTDDALFFGTDARWAKWREREKSSLNTQMAALRAEHDVQRSKTKKAFGKNKVAARLSRTMIKS